MAAIQCNLDTDADLITTAGVGLNRNEQQIIILTCVCKGLKVSATVSLDIRSLIHTLVNRTNYAIYYISRLLYNTTWVEVAESVKW